MDRYALTLLSGKEPLQHNANSLFLRTEQISAQLLERPTNEFRTQWQNRLAFYLYGFGEQAERFGDNETATRAFELADKVLPKEKYQEIIAKRIGPAGKFRVTMEDLKAA